MCLWGNLISHFQNDLSGNIQFRARKWRILAYACYFTCVNILAAIFSNIFSKKISEIQNKRWIITQNCRTWAVQGSCIYLSIFFPMFPLAYFSTLNAYSVSTHLVKSSGNSEIPGCGNIGGYCLKTREQEGTGDARLRLELFGSCTGRDPAPAKLGRKSPTSEVWCLDPLV